MPIHPAYPMTATPFTVEVPFEQSVRAWLSAARGETVRMNGSDGFQWTFHPRPARILVAPLLRSRGQAPSRQGALMGESVIRILPLPNGDVIRGLTEKAFAEAIAQTRAIMRSEARRLKDEPERLTP